MNKIISIIKEYNLVFHTTFLLLVVTNIIAWGYVFYQFIFEGGQKGDPPKPCIWPFVNKFH